MDTWGSPASPGAYRLGAAAYIKKYRVTYATTTAKSESTACLAVAIVIDIGMVIHTSQNSRGILECGQVVWGPSQRSISQNQTTNFNLFLSIPMFYTTLILSFKILQICMEKQLYTV